MSSQIAKTDDGASITNKKTSMERFFDLLGNYPTISKLWDKDKRCLIIETGSLDSGSHDRESGAVVELFCSLSGWAPPVTILRLIFPTWRC